MGRQTKKLEMIWVDNATRLITLNECTSELDIGQWMARLTTTFHITPSYPPCLPYFEGRSRNRPSCLEHHRHRLQLSFVLRWGLELLEDHYAIFCGGLWEPDLVSRCARHIQLRQAQHLRQHQNIQSSKAESCVPWSFH